MRDLSVAKRNSDGTVSFSVGFMSVISGVDILVDKVSKAIYNKNRSTNYFDFHGLDVSSLSSIGSDSSSLGSVKTAITSSLKNVEQDIIRGTPSYAPMSERLEKLILENVFYDSGTNNLYIKIRIYPKAGSAQIMTYPIDDRKW
jgi:hypothetical protein